MFLFLGFWVFIVRIRFFGCATWVYLKPLNGSPACDCRTQASWQVMQRDSDTAHSGKQGQIQGGRLPPVKPKRVTFFTTILYNSEKSIRDIRTLCRLLFYHSSVVKHSFTVVNP